MLFRGLSVSVVLLSVTLMAQAEIKSFRTIAGDVKNNVQFVSKATLEEITGRTVNVSGQVDLDLADLAATHSAGFEVDLTTIDTGISLRNQHMRENHLETDKFPKASFKLTRLHSFDKNSLAAGETLKGMADGDFTIHGVTKSYTIPVTLSYHTTDANTESRLSGNKGNLLFVSAEWKVKLEDHKINRPEFLFLKLAEEQSCSIGVAMTDAP